jgi:hypothetical protein
MYCSTRKFSVGLAFFLFVSVLSGCGDAGDKKEDVVTEEYSDESRRPDKGEKPNDGFLPFRLAFKSDGTIVILDEKGNVDEWDNAKFPLETKALYKLDSVTLAFVQGSCTVVTVVNNTVKTKTYPSSVCKYLGIPEN